MQQTGRLTHPAKIETTYDGTRKVDRVLVVGITPDGRATGPRGETIRPPAVYASKEDCAFDVDAFQYGTAAHTANPPRVLYDLVDGRAKNVQIIPLAD